MDGTNGPKETTRVTAPVASKTLTVRSDDGAIPALGSQSVVVDVWIPAAITHMRIRKNQNQRMSTIYRNRSRQ